jgi:hypothetical protein
LAAAEDDARLAVEPSREGGGDVDEEIEEDARAGPPIPKSTCRCSETAPRNVPLSTARPRLLACSWWEHAASSSSDVDASRALRLFDIVVN